MTDYQRVMTPSHAINELDLEPMKAKLIEEGEGHGWTLEKADAVGEAYRCFLYLNLNFPERYLVPTKDIDLFWHQHILDTQKYAEDCQRVFGKILHHFPYVGMRGEEDVAVWKDCFQKTLHLFRTEFPEAAERLDHQDKAALCVDETWPYAQDRIQSGVRPAPKR